MGVILINGVPGSGKTTIAYKLAAILEIEEVIQTDTIKEVFKVINHPEIALSTTHSAWKFFGEKNEQNIINGFKAHTKYFEDFLTATAFEPWGKTFIIISAFSIFGSIYTKKYKPWRIIYNESYASMQEARKRGFFLKTTSGRRLLKKIFLDYKK